MRYKISDETRFKRKRGLGAYEGYNPWIWVTDFSSIGLRVRVFGIKIKRLFHLLSLLETRVFYLLEYADSVCDIREQFPLQIKSTLEISSRLNIRHPKYLGVPIVMTTDFLIVTKTGLTAISVKYCKHLMKKRVREKFEIERVYWEERGVQFKIITEADITRNAYMNAERIRSFYYYKGSFTNQELIESLKIHKKQSSSLETFEALVKIADEFGKPVREIHHHFLHLLAVKEIRFDINSAPAVRTKLHDLCF